MSSNTVSDNTAIPAGVQASSASGAGTSRGTGSGAAPSVPSTTSTSTSTSNTAAGTTSSGSALGGNSSSSNAAPSASSADKSTGPIPGSAQLDPEVPRTSKEAPIFGVEAAKDVPFAQQVQGHAKYFAGKIFGNDKEVQQGAARARGEEDSLPADAKPTKTSSSSSNQ